MTSTDPPDRRTPGSSRSWTLHAFEGVVDVEVTTQDDAELSSVLDPLGDLLHTASPGLWAGSTKLSGELPLSAPELAHGAVLGVGRPGPRPAGRERSSALELHVTGGPEAGRTIAVESGNHVLGRGHEAQVRLDDPDVSRRHAVLEVGADGISVADLGSTNGSRLDHELLDGRRRAWATGAVLTLGSTSITVTGPGPGPARLSGPSGGRLTVQPAPRLPVLPPEVEVSFPREPEVPQRRTLPWAAVALPAVAGIAMALAMHTASFLFFAVLSPVVGVSSWASDRWSGGRRHRRDVAAHAVALRQAQARMGAALAADHRSAEAAVPDLAALLTAARRRSALLWSRRPQDEDALTVRLGTGRGAARVTAVAADGARTRAQGDDRPVWLDLRSSGGLLVAGPRPVALAVVRSLVAQVVTLHAPGPIELALVTDRDRLPDWTWGRWLPHLPSASVLTDVSAARAALAGQLAGRQSAPGGARGWLVVVVDRPADPLLSDLLGAIQDPQVVVLALAGTVADLPASGRAVLRCVGELGGEAVLSRAGQPEEGPVRVDRLGLGAVEELARDLAVLQPGRSAGALPREVRLIDLRSHGPVGEPFEFTGPWTRRRDSLVTCLGVAAEGPVVVDLCRAGPHALVAGTTGAGKSELLQTLITGLALNHPPDRCAFLLVDYKGGAAFAEASALPHTVGLLTDLDGTTTARALRSLAAELTRRETLLSAHAVADVADLPEHADLARLVIVVDEFATLAEELPTFVPGLIGIAQRGRSLGVHLVLATQRPAGVVSPEIRANCTLRLCLRTTDEADSRDVLGAPDAAHLPVELPGRAFLRTGAGTPAAFQVARVSCVPEPPGAPAQVRRWTWPTAPRPTPVRPTGSATDLARLVASIRERVTAEAVGLPHRPWLPPLPDALPIARLTPTPSSGRRIPIALVDRPDRQSQEVLELDLDEGGCWLALGGPRSGRTTLLRAVLAGAVQAAGPDEVHVHVLDHGGGALAAEAAGLAHAGTCIGDQDALRTVRLVDRLAEEIAARRAGTPRGGDRAAPRLVLLVDGAESLAGLLDESDPTRGSATLLRLVRDGAAVGLTCVLTADRAVPGGRLAAVAGRRLVLPLADRADYAVAGIRAGDVPAHRPPGRALLGEEARECQLALPGPLIPRPRAAAAATSPLSIPDLPSDPALGQPGPALDGAGGPVQLVLGPGGDEAGPVSIDLRRTGGLLVLGPPGSGRSSTLDAFAEDLRSRGAALLRLVGGRAPRGPQDLPAEGICAVAADDAEGVLRWLRSVPAGRPAVVVADDVGSAADWPALTGLPSAGASPAVVVLAAGSAGELAGHYQGPLAALRRSRTGVLLCPGPAEADVLGVRLPRTPVPARPGSGWLVGAGVPTRLQVARRRG